MKTLVQQLAGLFGTSFAAACCLGATAALSVLSVIGAGFLINDAVLIPAFLLLVGLSLALLHRSARAHRNLRPFWFGLAGGVIAFVSLWISPVLVVAGLAACVAASFWDFFGARAAAARGT